MFIFTVFVLLFLKREYVISNGTSNHLGLLYAERFRNHVHIYIFVWLFLKALFCFCYGMLSKKIFSNGSIWSTDETRTGSTTTGQSGPGSNVNKEILPLSKYPDLKHHHQMHSSIVHRIALFV